MPVLPRAFFARDTVTVARALLGQRLVRVLDGHRLSGLISETEAYRGADDVASHAYRLTPRSAIMYGLPGIAYVYFIYGRNFCLNVVTESSGQPGAVLIRGIQPETGLEIMRPRRGFVAGDRPGRRNDRGLTDGPGKLCQALGIDGQMKGADLTLPGALFIEEGQPVEDAQVEVTPRVGVCGDDEALGRPWRFLWRPAGATAAPR
jgi:DNA-3-methyladenine glycosylase